MRNCLRCGKEFDPGKTRRRYCTDECSQAARDSRRPRANPELYITAEVITYHGSRQCTNCRSNTAGPRWAFWWDDFDRADKVMETSMLLCYPCRFKFNKVKARQDSRIMRYELDADRAERPSFASDG